MDPYASGSITLEYYDGSSDFSESEDSDASSENAFCFPSNPRSAYTPEDVQFKTYDFKYSDKDTDSEPAPSDLKKLRSEPKPTTAKARQIMNSHYKITRQERINSLTHPRASFARCPRGGVREPNSRKNYPGPFLTCPFSHECGDEYDNITHSRKPLPEFNMTTRPPYLKERKAPFYKQCKECESYTFTHHRNPAQHYQDYLNNVTYKHNSDQTKVWQQHLADLKYVFEGHANHFDENIAAKCKDYKPTTAADHASKYRRIIRRKPSVIAKRRPVLTRPARFDLKPNASKHSDASEHDKSWQSEENSRDSSPQRSEQKPTRINDRIKEDSNYNDKQSSRTHLNPSTRSSFLSTVSSRLHRNFTARSHQQSSAVTIYRRQQASVANLNKSRQNTAKVSKRFVRKPKPPKQAKYIQKVRPNISAKFLRVRSKNKHLSASNSHAHRPSKSRGNHETKNAINIMRLKNLSQIPRKNARLSSSITKTNTSNDDSSEEGSYAQFRNKNGEFDEEKYRQSILKMLGNSGNARARDRKKKQRTKRRHKQPNFIELPKVKNLYSNVKSKIVSNIPQRRRRKNRKPKTNSLDFSDFSLKSKSSKDTVVDYKDSYFSIPSLDK